MRLNPLRLAGALAAFGLLCARDTRAQETWSAADYFERAVALNQGQLAALSRGEVVGKLLVTGDERDVAAFAAINIDVPRSFFTERERDFTRALAAPNRRDFHLFSNPANDADVKSVQISVDDLKELRDCRPSACNFKLPVAEMDRAKGAELSSESSARASAYARRRMVEFVTDYRRRGNDAMLVYDDNGSVHSNDAFAAMISDSSFLFRVVPSLAHFLMGFPQDTLAGATQSLFWSIDELPHVRPVLRIMHQTVYSPPEISNATIVAGKQLYANHYFEAGLELLTAVDRTAAASAKTGGITLIAIRRYRFDHLPSGGILNLKGRLRDGLKDNVMADLARLKRDYETAWRASHAP